MHKINYNKVLRIAIGSTLSFFICHLFGIKNSASAAVITLLSVQDTKKDTISDVAKRFCSYVLSMVMAYFLFTNIGYNEIAFFIFMLILVTVAYKLNWLNTLSSSTVVTTHFLLEKSFAPDFVKNEIFLVVVGTTIAVLLNGMLKDNSVEIRRNIEYIESHFKSFLYKMQRFLLSKGELPDEEWIGFLENHIEKGVSQSANLEKNTFDDTSYYLDYMLMRDNQLETLVRIYHSLKMLGNDFPLKQDIADIFMRLADNMQKRECYIQNRPLILGAISKYKKQPLPNDMSEMIIMAELHDVLNELLYFSDLKKTFYDHLTQPQLKRYNKETTEGVNHQE